jgi:hypothetical protein
MEHVPARSPWHTLWEKLKITEPDLVTDLFIVFSRFEYALKRSGYLRQNIHDAEPDWDTFGTKNENKQRFDSDANAEFKQAVEYLVKHPPQKQIRTSRDSFKYEAKPLGGQSGLHETVLAIRRVRNNLFHGGKFPNGPFEDSARDVDLLRHSLTVLEHILELDDRVQRFFWEA